MNEFKRVLPTIQNLTWWSQFISWISAGFSIAVILSIMTGQAFVFCWVVGALLSVVFETGIRKLYPTFIQIVGFSELNKLDKTDKTLLSIIGFFVLFCLVTTIFCSVFAVPYLSKFLAGQISSVWSVFLAVIAVSSTLVTLLGLTYEQVLNHKQKLESQKDTTKTKQAVNTTIKRQITTKRTKKTGQNKAVIDRLINRTKKQYQRQFDKDISEKSKQNNHNKCKEGIKELEGFGYRVITDDKVKTISIVKQ